MRKEKSRDAARSRRSKENHEFYELAKLLPLPAAITSQLDFLDKASIIRLTISFLKLRQFSVNGHPPWAPDFTTLGSVNPYSSQQYVTASTDTSASAGATGAIKSAPDSTLHTAQSPSARLYSSPAMGQEFGPADQPFASRFPTEHLAGSSYHQQHQHVDPDKASQFKNSASLFDIHLGTHILQSLDGFAFAIGRDGRFLYISETVSMYLGLSQVEMTGSSVFDYTHQQDHEELARQLGIPFTCSSAPSLSANLIHSASDNLEQPSASDSPAPASVHSQYSAASNETLIDDYINNNTNNNMSPCAAPPKRLKLQQHHSNQPRGSYSAARLGRRSKVSQRAGGIKLEPAGQYSNSPYTSFNASTSLHNNKDHTPQLVDKSLKGEPPSMMAPEDPHNPLVRQFCIRMKSTLTKRGCQHFKSSGYRVVHVVAHLRSYQSNDHGHLMDPLDEAGSTGTPMSSKQTRNRRGPKPVSTASGGAAGESTSGQSSNGNKQNTVTNDTSLISDMNNLGNESKQQKIIGMVAVAIALPPPSINELRLESDTFVLKLAPDLRITHIEPRITELLNYPVEMMAGRSLYSLVHPADLMQLQKCHKDLLKKGQIMSGYYRLLARNGGYLWIQTCATLICNGSNTSVGSQNQTITAPSPVMATPQAIQEQFHHHQQPSGSKIQPPANYLPAALFNSESPHYGVAGGATGKMLSPGLTSSYQDSHQESDQCVIFVNYMITNVMESEVIMDICQSTQLAPVSFSTSGPLSNHHTQPGGNILFSSSASSCSAASPCSVGLLKANSSASGFAGYLSPSSTPNAENSGLNHSESPNCGAQYAVVGSGEKLAAAKSKGMTNGRIRNLGYKPKQHAKVASELVHEHQDKLTSQVNFCNLIEPPGKGSMDAAPFNLLNMNGHQDSGVCPTALYASYPQQVQGDLAGVNLALPGAANKAGVHESGASWLSHHPHQTSTKSRTLNNGSLTPYAGTTTVAAAAAAAAARQVVSGSGHYSPMNHSIYKAAFGLDVNAASSNGYQQTASGYPTQVNNNTGAAAASAATTTTPGFQQVTATPQATSTAGWDTASAAAAVAAANQYQHQHQQPVVAHHHQHHQHQHHQTQVSHPLSNPYAHHHHHHLDASHHHLESAHSQALSSAAAAAAAAAVAVNHHSATTTNNYYNYCGYYGNKFI